MGSTISAPTTVVGITSDVLYPTAEQRELVDLIGTARYAEIDAPHGHDAFLVEGDAVNEILKEHLADIAAEAA